MSPTPSGGQEHLWCARYRTAAAAVKLYHVAAEMYSCSSTATAAAATSSFYLRSCAVGHRVLPALDVTAVATPASMIPPLFGQSASNHQHSAAFSFIILLLLYYEDIQ